MSEWQPIETAPKDGTVLLGYENKAGVEMFTFRWCEHRGWISEIPWGDWDRVDPTHWMPLPEPPA